jgi:hypothetical protein
MIVFEPNAECGEYLKAIQFDPEIVSGSGTLSLDGYGVTQR